MNRIWPSVNCFFTRNLRILHTIALDGRLSTIGKLMNLCCECYSVALVICSALLYTMSLISRVHILHLPLKTLKFWQWKFDLLGLQRRSRSMEKSGKCSWASKKAFFMNLLLQKTQFIRKWFFLSLQLFVEKTNS